MEQTTYVSHCIKAILALYKNKINNVVLIGHSMVGNINIYLINLSMTERLNYYSYLGWYYSKGSSFINTGYECFVCKHDNKLGYS
jgi:hypothetical protein